MPPPPTPSRALAGTKDGGGTAKTSTATEKEDIGTGAQTACGKCSKDFNGITSSPGDQQCGCCGGWFCAKCANTTKKTDQVVLGRHDVVWLCGTKCIDFVQNSVQKLFRDASSGNAGTASADVLDEKLGAVETKLFDKMAAFELKFESKLDALLEAQTNVSKSVNDTVENSVAKNVNKAWATVAATTLFGDDTSDSGEFPSIDDDEFKMAPVKRSCKNNVNLIKEAMVEHKKDEENRESRLTNIMIFKAEEHEDPNAKVRQDKDAELVQEFLDSVEIEESACKIVRLGKYEERTGPRPLKVCFENQETQQKVMNNLKKLQSAPERIQALSIAYDLCEAERQQAKTLNDQARTQSKNSKEYVFKVKGQPGKMEIKRYYKRKNQTSANKTT